MKSGANESGGLRYAATFKEKILGAGCDIDVSVDIGSKETVVFASMTRMLSSQPVFRISRDDLAALASCVKAAKERASILDRKAEGACDHQLNYSFGGATFIIVKPKSDKPASYTLTIGLFHQEGLLEELSTTEFDQAVEKLDTLASRVKSKV
jgi:hypothetical protein